MGKKGGASTHNSIVRNEDKIAGVTAQGVHLDIPCGDGGAGGVDGPKYHQILFDSDLWQIKGVDSPLGQKHHMPTLVGRG